MKKIILLALCLGVAAFSKAQVITIGNPELIPMKMERTSPALRDVPEHPPTLKELNGPRVEHDNPSLEHPMQIVNPNALPVGEDPALQRNYSHVNERTEAPTTAGVISNWAGLTAAVEPSDCNIAVGPNHVVQMTNNSKSTYIRIWNKAGTVLVANKLVSSITGITDYGDPNVLYDQQADRYLLVVLYSKSAKKLVVCESKTSDPTGAWYVYTFSTPNGFPDYPKIGVWDNSYLITTNSNSPTIYALNRSAMLAGQSIGTVQMFSLSKFPDISFQSASPISQTGAVAPPAGSPASVIRVADDAWSNTLGPDHLELFNLNISWVTPSSSTITGPIKLYTIAYNSNLCGFGSGSCIPQPGSTVKLDPLSDIVMDKVQYRNLGSYQSIVCSHVCNADGNGTAGIRWYELRNTGSGWSIYQQSTYSPDANGRFMSSVSINSMGTIALGYNISSSSVYPGVRITGRDSCDAINTMTVPETTVETGAKANSSIRYGDYNGMVTDPTDDSFWFTANYNVTSAWSTNVVHFSFNTCPVTGGRTADEVNNKMKEDAISGKLSLVPNPATGEVMLTFFMQDNVNAPLQVFDMTGKLVMRKVLPAVSGSNSSTLDIHALESGCYFVEMVTGNGKETQKLIIQR